MHFNTAYGKYQGWTTEYEFNELLNSSHIYDTCFVNDTTMYVDYGYNWKTYTPPTPTKKKNNWRNYIYSKKKIININY